MTAFLNIIFVILSGFYFSWLAVFRFTTVITIHTHTLALEGTVISNAGRAVFIIHTFRAPILPEVAHQIVGAV